MTTLALPPEVPVAVVGAGTMGAGIARVAAGAGHRVLLFDAVPGAVERALGEVGARLERSVAKGRLSPADASEIRARLVAGDDPAGAADAGLVIEAIVEDVAVKQDVLSRFAAAAEPDAILATNTSSLSVTAIAASIERPERVVGMHFFNPAPVMPLVEVVAGAETSAAIVDRVAATASAWGKTPVRCTSTPGFIVNRVARPFYGEALRLLQEQVAGPSVIDAVVASAAGFKMGPFTLMDLVGLDVNLAVSKSVYAQTFHDTRFAPNVAQQALVDAGHLGRKTGRGFYDHGVAAPTAPVEPPAAAPDVIEVIGDVGWAAGLVPRLRDRGMMVEGGRGSGPGHLVVDGVHVVPTSGLTATAMAASGAFGSGDVVVFDLVRDWEAATGVALAAADQAGPGTVSTATGVFQAAGYAVHAVDDAPALVVMRIVTQLASVAADALHAGVASAADIDTAMRLGTNYPEGPLEWADRLGATTVVGVLDRLRAHYGEDRYRAAPMLRRAALTGAALRDL